MGWDSDGYNGLVLDSGTGSWTPCRTNVEVLQLMRQIDVCATKNVAETSKCRLCDAKNVAETSNRRLCGRRNVKALQQCIESSSVRRLFAAQTSKWRLCVRPASSRSRRDVRLPFVRRSRGGEMGSTCSRNVKATSARRGAGNLRACPVMRRTGHRLCVGQLGCRRYGLGSHLGRGMGCADGSSDGEAMPGI